MNSRVAEIQSQINELQNKLDLIKGEEHKSLDKDKGDGYIKTSHVELDVQQQNDPELNIDQEEEGLQRDISEIERRLQKIRQHRQQKESEEEKNIIHKTKNAPNIALGYLNDNPIILHKNKKPTLESAILERIIKKPSITPNPQSIYQNYYGNTFNDNIDSDNAKLTNDTYISKKYLKNNNEYRKLGKHNRRRFKEHLRKLGSIETSNGNAESKKTMIMSSLYELTQENQKYTSDGKSFLRGKFNEIYYGESRRVIKAIEGVYTARLKTFEKQAQEEASSSLLLPR